jgi:membrane protease YdiL (CAAX protease family)
MLSETVAHQPSDFSLTKLTYLMSGTVLVYDSFNRFGSAYLMERVKRYPVQNWSTIANYSYPTLILLFVLIMLFVASFYRPLRLNLRWTTKAVAATTSLKTIASGLVAGVGSAVVAAPFLLSRNMGAPFVARLIADAISPSGILVIVLIIPSLAISTEIVFRGIVFRTFAEYTAMPAAIIGSCLLFAHLWPLFGQTAGIIFGVVSAFLYHRTRRLAACVIANVTFTILAGVFALMFRGLL